MNILITRHGQTEWNVLKKVQGRADISLNETGISQALETKKNLDDKQIDLIICSPLKRAKETAEIINKDRNIPIIYDDRIAERDFGEFEGTNVQDFDFPGFWNYYKNEKYQRAENVQDFFQRIYKFLDDIIEKYKDKNVLIVSHGGVSMPAACYFSKEIPLGTLLEAGILLENCQVASYNID